MAAKKKDQSIARAGFAQGVGAKRSHKYFTILPSKIRANHGADNHDRAALYSLAKELPELVGHPALFGDRICYTRAEVMKRADSFKRVGQENAITTYRSNTHEADVGAGFLRHLAALYLEVTGELSSCPRMATGLICRGEDQPKNPLLAVDKNHAENERKETTAIDRAWLCKRYETLGLSRTDIAAKLGCDKRSIDRYLQLLTLSPSVQLDVHEGRKSMMKALSEASAQGKGSARGQNPGIRRAAIRRRDPAKRPAETLTAAQIDALIDVLIGDKTDEVDEQVAAWVDYVDAPAPKSRKTAPPKPGKGKRK